MRHSHFLINITFDFWHLHCIQYAHPLQSAVGAKRIFTSTSKTVHLPAPGHIVLQHHAIWCGANEWGAKSHCIAQARGPCPCINSGVNQSLFTNKILNLCLLQHCCIFLHKAHCLISTRLCCQRNLQSNAGYTQSFFFIQPSDVSVKISPLLYSDSRQSTLISVNDRVLIGCCFSSMLIPQKPVVRQGAVPMGLKVGKFPPDSHRTA